MKIIKEGVLPEHRKPDYAGKTFKCSSCRAEIELDENDTLNQEKCPNGKRWFDCPTCNSPVYVPIYRESRHFIVP